MTEICAKVSMFDGISTFIGYLMPNSLFKKNSNDDINLSLGG